MSRDIDKRIVKILKENFPDMKESSIEAYLYLLKQARQHGQFVEQVPKTVLNEVKKALFILEKIDSDHHFERRHIQRAISQLKKITNAKTLHGLQHTSNYREKVALADQLHKLWTFQKGAKPPATWQKDTHPYSKFVTDVLSALELTWTARQLIDAHDKFSTS